MTCAGGRGIHVNPWSHFPRLITSIDFLKRERPLRLFREPCPRPDEPIYPRKFDLLIVDEAHNCAPSGAGPVRHRLAADPGAAGAGPALRTQAVPDRHAAQRLPGELRRPARTARQPAVRPGHRARPQATRCGHGAAPQVRPSFAFNSGTARPGSRRGCWSRSRFPTPTRSGRSTPPSGSTPSCGRSGREDNAERFATEFVLKTLKKRLFSCPAAFLTTLEQHEKSLHTATQAGPPGRASTGVLQQELDRMDEDYADDSEYDEATADAVDAAPACSPSRRDEELALLKQMQDWAETARGQLDSKVRAA